MPNILKIFWIILLLDILSHRIVSVIGEPSTTTDPSIGNNPTPASGNSPAMQNKTPDTASNTTPATKPNDTMSMSSTIEELDDKLRQYQLLLAELSPRVQECHKSAINVLKNIVDGALQSSNIETKQKAIGAFDTAFVIFAFDDNKCDNSDEDDDWIGFEWLNIFEDCFD